MEDENFKNGTFNTKYLEEFNFNPEK